MPKFGDYETIDEPIRVTEAVGHVSTIWKARHAVTQDGVVYLIKHFALRTDSTDAAGAFNIIRQPDGDPLRDFIDGVKQLAQAQSKSRQTLAPIHACGNTDGEAWYATDFYPRKTLKEFINLQGGVEGRSLERVVYRVVSGCLALQRSTGRSHGNLKASNVLLAGKPQHLRRTPLHLIDPLPVRASALRALRGPTTQDPAEQIRQQTERADVRSIGELILQLVEGRIIASGYDYNYPVAASPAWSNLGKDGGLWRQRCNQLLNPQLKLNEINLQSLENEFQSAPFAASVPKILVGCVGASALAAAVYYTVDKTVLKPGVQPAEQMRLNGREEWGRLLAASQEAEARNEWRVARDMLAQALHKSQELNDAALRQQTDRELSFAQAMADIFDTLRAGKPEQARPLVEKALLQRPNDATVLGLKGQIEAAVAESSKQAEFQQLMDSARKAESDEQWPRALDLIKQALLRASTLKDPKFRTPASDELKYAQKMDLAQRLLDDKAHPDFFLAIANARDALALKPGSTNAAIRLIARAQDRMRRELSQASPDPNPALQVRPEAPPPLDHPAPPDPSKLRADEALAAAQLALSQRDYAEAVRQADAVLSIRRQDPQATQLKANAQAGLTYQTALRTAQAAFNQRDYAETIRQADTVLRISRQDPQATKLKADAQAGLSYQTALRTAQAAFGQRDYAETIRQADAVLAISSQDPQATKLKADAQAALNYQVAWNGAQAAFDQKDYTEAIRQADLALRIRSQDVQVSQLKAAAQGEQAYQLELNEARQAFLSGDFAEAIRHSQSALQQKKAETEPVEIIEAAKLKQAKGQKEKELQGKYQEGLSAGRLAYERGDYSKAAAQAEGVLSLRPKDPEAIKLKSLAQQEQGYLAATMAFTQGDYSKALGQCQPYQGTERFDRLAQQIGQEQSQLGAVQKALAEGSYGAILTGALPGKAVFETLKASASEENRALQQASQRLAAGDYGFIDILEQQSYRTKPPFLALLETGRKERETLKALQGMKIANQRQTLLRELSRLAQDVRAKKPFADLVPAPEPSPDSGFAAARSERYDRLLESWEIMFGVRARPADSDIKPVRDPTKDSSFTLKQFDKLEADFAGAGSLDAERKRRLNVLRSRVRGGPAE